MNITYRLKRAIHVSFARDGFYREEGIRYLTVRGPIAAANGEPVNDDQEPNSPEKVAKFVQMLDLDDDGHKADATAFLTYGNLDVAVDDAYRAARWRALDYIWGKNQVHDPDAQCPRSFDAPSEAAAKAHMMAAAGFDFSDPDSIDPWAEEPADVDAKAKPATAGAEAEPAA